MAHPFGLAQKLNLLVPSTASIPPRPRLIHLPLRIPLVGPVL